MEYLSVLCRQVISCTTTTTYKPYMRNANYSHSVSLETSSNMIFITQIFNDTFVQTTLLQNAWFLVIRVWDISPPPPYSIEIIHLFFMHFDRHCYSEKCRCFPLEHAHHYPCCIPFLLSCILLFK